MQAQLSELQKMFCKDSEAVNVNSLEEGESAADEPVFVEPRVRIAPLHLFT